MHPKGDTQDVTQGVTQEETLDEKIEKAIKDNLNITTEELAKQFGVTSMTIKRHLAKMPHIHYVGSGYSGHWEVLDNRVGGKQSSFLPTFVFRAHPINLGD